MSILPHENILHLPYQTWDIPNADYFVRVPDGKYVAEFIGAEGFWYRGRGPRVVLWFVIIEGSQKGARVPALLGANSPAEIYCRPGFKFSTVSGNPIPGEVYTG